MRLSAKLKIWIAILTISFIGTAAVWYHALMTFWIDPPFDNRFDQALWFTASLSRFVMLAAIVFWVVPGLMPRLYRNRRRSFIALIAWAVPILALVYGLNPWRPALAQGFNSSVSRYYPVHLEGVGQPETYPGLSSFLGHWNTGAIFMDEFAVVILALAMIVFAGYTWGNHKWLTSIVAVPLAGIASLMLANVLPVTLIDYDFFFGSTVLGPAVVDIFFPMIPGDPFAEFAMPIYLLFISAGCCLDWMWSRPGKRHTVQTVDTHQAPA